MAAKYPVKVYPDSVTQEQLRAGLEEVRGEVCALKEQVRGRFEEVFQQLSINRNSLLTELDQIVETISEQLNERENKLNYLIAKRMQAQREILSDILNLDLQQDIIKCDERVCEILAREIQFPRATLEWSEMPTEGICRVEKIPNKYRFSSDPVWSSADRGGGADQLFFPISVCSDSMSGCIFVSDANLTTSRLQVFSTEGEHVEDISHEGMDYINAIAASEKSLFVATECKLIKMTKHGEVRHSIELLTNINAMDFAHEKLYACCKRSSAIRLINDNLETTDVIELKPLSFGSQTSVYDLKVLRNSIYVLFGFSRLLDGYFPYPVQQFDNLGILVKSVVPGNSIVKAYSFVVSENSSIIVSDWGANRIKVFSRNGERLRTIGRDGAKRPGEIYLPRGVALDDKERILVVDGKDQNKLQAF